MNSSFFIINIIKDPLPSPKGVTSALMFLSVYFLTLNEFDLSFYKFGNIFMNNLDSLEALGNDVDEHQD